ncbi:OmpH family outer membrane protein [Pseudogemmobacter bohemicus]|uniref:OmpH family outer membrane protein n=1 Tax=Pseudogemmobacter bohemicus TaxID=2250708 RepID=UPI0013007231|nr:OmpH family outer membrane protein [Pseudogemmobacter bohemicus]
MAMGLGSAAMAQDGTSGTIAPDPAGGSTAVADGTGNLALLTLNQAALFEKSAWGAAAMRAAEQAASALSAENRTIEAALEKEELGLTEKRGQITAEEFSALARDFDRKVEEFRQTQDAKLRAINRKLDEDRKTFVELSVPLMAELLDEYGAVAIIADDILILSRSSADVTQRAIELMNQRLPMPEEPGEAPAQDGQGVPPDGTDTAPGSAP